VKYYILISVLFFRSKLLQYTWIKVNYLIII
jgi:hypothetical protein